MPWDTRAPNASLACVRLTENASLRELNSFGIDAQTRWLARIDAAAELPELLGDRRYAALPLLVLGEGSNVLLTRDWPGLVVRIDAQSVSASPIDQATVLVRAEAGMGWHALVEWTLAQGLSGIENLALIPGLVGAAPIQNIGAYGVELDAVVESVEVFDRAAHTVALLAHAQCGFGYRDSVFKRTEGRARFIVTAVSLRLKRDGQLVTHYQDVEQELKRMGVAQPQAADVARAVIALRQRKLPDPALIGNAGSFFKNPLVDTATAARLQAAHPMLPLFAAGPGLSKLSAAWLIEQAGFKGVRDGDAGVSAKHALVLVNHGAASGAQLLALAQRVQHAVMQRFGVGLEAEPHIV